MIVSLDWHFCTRNKWPNQENITSPDHSDVSKKSNQDSIWKWKRHVSAVRIRKYCDEDSGNKILSLWTQSMSGYQYNCSEMHIAIKY